LGAIGEEEALEQLNIVPFNDFAFTKLIGLYHLYALLGGMPEVIKKYAETRDITALNKIYNSLITSYLDDVEKYAHSNNQVQAIRHAIKASFFEAGKRIKFQGFGKSNYGSKEMGEALRTLEKAFILSLIYPTTGTKLPIIPDYKKSPRLQLLDTGLLNYMVGLQKDLLGSNDLNAVYQGTLIEHLVGQELIADQYQTLASLNFWTREKNTSSAEIDYLINYEGQLIPIEVKAGKEGKLKSLHLFMDETPGNIAVRFYAGKISITEVKTVKGKEFKLLNLPYFLAGKVREYLDWMEGL
jgi:predicted AAA+ superfamily ATPase